MSQEKQRETQWEPSFLLRDDRGREIWVLIDPATGRFKRDAEQHALRFPSRDLAERSAK